MQKVFNSVLIAPLICFYSCAYWPVPQSYRLAMDCYDSTYTGIDTLIEIHGYYRDMKVYDHTGWSKKVEGQWVECGLDTFYLDFLFFKDGLWIYNFGGYGLPHADFLTMMADSGYTFALHRGFQQGIYKIFGDTIITQTIADHGGRVFGGLETKWKIIDKNTLLRVHSKQMVVAHIDRNNEAYQPKYIHDAYPAKFHYVEKMPVSSSWLKNEDWFWCDSVP
jgi:hypothetical protein